MNNGRSDVSTLSDRDISDLSDSDALDNIGVLIDAAHNAGSSAGDDHAFAFLDELTKRSPEGSDAALLHYFRANAWENRRHQRADLDPWAWEQPEAQAQILELRCAVRHEGFGPLPPVRQSQILTNLANQFNSMGRFIEAITLWDRVLKTNDHFAMAHGNRGIGLHS